jgi:hypothetical protein
MISNEQTGREVRDQAQIQTDLAHPPPPILR